MAKIKLLTDDGLRRLVQLIDEKLSKKVNKEDGKGLSSQDFTAQEKFNLAYLKSEFNNVLDAVISLKKWQKSLIVNDLITGGEDKALSAEQGKVLFQNVDDGKNLVANAIIGKGQNGVSKESTFQELATAIGSISGGGGSSELEYIPQTTDDEPMIYNSTIQTFLRNNRSRIVIFPNVFRGLSGPHNSLFALCPELRIVPGVNMVHVTSAKNMFSGAPKLELIGALKTSNKLTDVSEMFAGCGRIKFVPKFDTSGVTNFSGIFKGCSSLDIPKMRAAGWPEEYLQTAPNYRAP